MFSLQIYFHIDTTGTKKRGPYAFLVGGSLNAHAAPIWDTDMRFCLKRHQPLYYISVNSKGSGETALMRRLAWAFAVAYVIPFSQTETCMFSPGNKFFPFRVDHF